MMDTSNPLLMHFTHVRNLPGIIKHGLQADGSSPEIAVECAEPGIKARRRLLRVPIAPGGVVADYVSFAGFPSVSQVALVMSANG